MIDLASLAGGAIDGHVIATLEHAGYPGLRTRHGYVVQRLLSGDHTATDIARSLGVTQQAASKTVAELVQLGYVRRDVDAHDGRRRALALSDRGLAAVDTARRARAELLNRVARDVGGDRISDAAMVLRSILDALGVGQRVDGRAVPPPPGA